MLHFIIIYFGVHSVSIFFWSRYASLYSLLVCPQHLLECFNFWNSESVQAHYVPFLSHPHNKHLTKESPFFYWTMIFKGQDTGSRSLFCCWGIVALPVERIRQYLYANISWRVLPNLKPFQYQLWYHNSDDSMYKSSASCRKMLETIYLIYLITFKLCEISEALCLRLDTTHTISLHIHNYYQSWKNVKSRTFLVLSSLNKWYLTFHTEKDIVIHMWIYLHIYTYISTTVYSENHDFVLKSHCNLRPYSILIFPLLYL